MLRKLRRMLLTSEKILHYNSNVKEARAVIINQVAVWAPICGVQTKRIAIRNQKRSWGSCSSLGNLNFNYKLLYLPRCMVDYVIVHELCHLKFLNHSRDFWLEVEKYYPNYKSIVNDLRHLEKQSCLSPVLLAEFTKKHSCQYCSNE